MHHECMHAVLHMVTNIDSSNIIFAYIHKNSACIRSSFNAAWRKKNVTHPGGHGHPSIHTSISTIAMTHTDTSIDPSLAPSIHPVITHPIPCHPIPSHPSIHPSIDPRIHPSIQPAIRPSRPSLAPFIHPSIHTGLLDTLCKRVQFGEVSEL